MEKRRRKTRSEGYQNLFAETICSNEMMESFCNEDSIKDRLNPFKYNEDLINLEDELKKEFWRIVNSLLTDRQKEVIRLLSDGLTQMEIAKKLEVNQSSITKSINGNVSYLKGRTTYGGAKKKLKKIIQSDEKIIEILRKMMEIRDEEW